MSSFTHPRNVRDSTKSKTAKSIADTPRNSHVNGASFHDGIKSSMRCSSEEKENSAGRSLQRSFAKGDDASIQTESSKSDDEEGHSSTGSVSTQTSTRTIEMADVAVQADLSDSSSYSVEKAPPFSFGKPPVLVRTKLTPFPSILSTLTPTRRSKQKTTAKKTDGAYLVGGYALRNTPARRPIVPPEDSSDCIFEGEENCAVQAPRKLFDQEGRDSSTDSPGASSKLPARSGAARKPTPLSAQSARRFGAKDEEVEKLREENFELKIAVDDLRKQLADCEAEVRNEVVEAMDEQPRESKEWYENRIAQLERKLEELRTLKAASDEENRRLKSQLGDANTNINDMEAEKKGPADILDGAIGQFEKVSVAGRLEEMDQVDKSSTKAGKSNSGQEDGDSYTDSVATKPSSSSSHQVASSDADRAERDNSCVASSSSASSSFSSSSCHDDFEGLLMVTPPRPTRERSDEQSPSPPPNSNNIDAIVSTAARNIDPVVLSTLLVAEGGIDGDYAASNGSHGVMENLTALKSDFAFSPPSSICSTQHHPATTQSPSRSSRLSASAAPDADVDPSSCEPSLSSVGVDGSEKGDTRSGNDALSLEIDSEARERSERLEEELADSKAAADAEIGQLKVKLKDAISKYNELVVEKKELAGRLDGAIAGAKQLEEEMAARLAESELIVSGLMDRVDKLGKENACLKEQIKGSDMKMASEMEKRNRMGAKKLLWLEKEISLKFAGELASKEKERQRLEAELESSRSKAQALFEEKNAMGAKLSGVSYHNVQLVERAEKCERELARSEEDRASQETLLRQYESDTCTLRSEANDMKARIRAMSDWMTFVINGAPTQLSLVSAERDV